MIIRLTRRIGLLACTFVLAAAMLGCKQTTTDIALVIYDYSDLYMQDFRELIYDNNDQSLYQFVSYDSQNSQIIQNEIINNIFEQDPSLIIINPVDRLGVYPIIEKAKRNGIAIIFINREPLAEDLEMYDRLYYVGAKPEQSAMYQAEIIIDLFGGDPTDLNEYDRNNDGTIQCILLKGQPGHQDAEIRTDQVIQELEDNGFILDLLSIEEAYFSQQMATEQMTGMIAQHGSAIELVIANNDAMAIGAINALVENGLIEDTDNDGQIDHSIEPWIPVVGIDGLPIALESIDNGFLAGTVINDSNTMAKAINELAAAVLNGTPENLTTFVLEDGMYIWIDYQTYTPGDES